jgi:hypothetical protein
MTETKQKRVVLVSKSLPKMLRDLARIHPENLDAVQIVIDKKGTIAATTLKDQAVEKETKK